MFKCKQCGIVSDLYIKENKKIIETKKRIYWNVIVFDFVTKTKKIIQYKEKDLKILEELKNDKGYKILKEYITHGTEIVKELTVCAKCNS